MKKIIAAAVATAFVAPAMAADVSVNGLVDFAYQDANGVKTTTSGDQAFYISASSELDNGITVSTDINIASNAAGDAGPSDGSSSITVAGPFGTLDLGDTSGADDAFDDRNDNDVVIGGNGVSGKDAGVAYTLPALMDGLTVKASYTPSGGAGGTDQDGEPGTGFGVEYAIGNFEVAYATLDADTATASRDYLGASASLGGLTVNVERMTIDVTSSSADEEETTIGFTYGMGDMTIAVSNLTIETKAGATAHDTMFYGVKYGLGEGTTLFAEMKSDDQDADGSEDKTAVGISYAF